MANYDCVLLLHGGAAAGIAQIFTLGMLADLMSKKGGR